MFEYQRSAEETVKCLKDCGCDERTEEQFLAYEKEDRTKDQIRLLNKSRRSLMDDLHKSQKKVDCIDFIIRELEQKMRG